MNIEASCPKCNSKHTYIDVTLRVCAECAHEWNENESPKPSEGVAPTLIKDAHGNVLSDRDSVSVIKDLKVKGTSSVVKVGTKVRNIRLTDGDDGHNIACKIDGFGAMNLKSEFVKKI